MPLSEIYIKLVVGFPRDPKVRRLVSVCGMEAGLARDLFLAMALYCKENLTDGWVPAEEVGALAYPLPVDHGNQLAKQLASVGLIKEASKDEAQGWQVLAYLKRNGTREDVERLSRVRAEAGRKGGRPPGKTAARKPRQATGNQVAKQKISRPNPETESETESGKDLQAPTVPAAGAAGGKQIANQDASPGLTVTQRSKRLTDAYAEAEPMCKWPAVNGVVISAIKSGRFADDEIRAALLRLAADGRSVTVDTLRTELQGLPAGRQAAGRRHEPYRNPEDQSVYDLGFSDVQ